MIRQKNAIMKVLNSLMCKILPSKSFQVKLERRLSCWGRRDKAGLKYKSHRRRSANKNTDALAIVEFKIHIKGAYAFIIHDKKSETLVPKICSKVSKTNYRVWLVENLSFFAGFLLRSWVYLTRFMSLIMKAVLTHKPQSH